MPTHREPETAQEWKWAYGVVYALCIRLRVELIAHTNPTLAEAEASGWDGLEKEEWLEMAYENRCESAATALKGDMLPAAPPAEAEEKE